MTEEREKLVRDLIPKLAEQDGHGRVVRHLEGEELRAVLIDKLREETEEVAADLNSAEELADVLEACRALARFIPGGLERVVGIQISKRLSLGGFDSGVIMAFPVCDVAKQLGPRDLDLAVRDVVRLENSYPEDLRGQQEHFASTLPNAQDGLVEILTEIYGRDERQVLWRALTHIDGDQGEN